MFESTILPFWLVGPIAALTMLVIAGHLIALRDAKARIPASRYRVRTVNGGIMLALAPLLAAAFSVISPGSTKAFLIIWFACVGLLAIVVLLALVDAFNNVRLFLLERRELREARRDVIAEALDRRRGHEG